MNSFRASNHGTWGMLLRYAEAAKGFEDSAISVLGV